MNGLFQAIAQAGRHLLDMGLGDIVDILLVTALVYLILSLIRTTRSYKVFQGIMMILFALWLSGELQLHTVNFILRKAVELGLLAVVILFQPELRRLLERLGNSTVKSLFTAPVENPLESCISQTVLACKDLSASRTGALIIFERTNKLSEQIRTGTIVDAETTAELMKNIFFVKAPLHDGAVIMRDGRIHAAGCVLPLTDNNNLSKDLGMRHRAGLGMSEASDALVIIISEETGAISVALNGLLKRHLNEETLTKLLRTELMKEDAESEKQSLLERIRTMAKGKNDDGKKV